MEGARIKARYVGSGVSVALFGYKLLDGLPIILGEPSLCDQFDYLHKEGVPVGSAKTPHSDVKHLLGAQFILSILPILAWDKDSWDADHPVFVIHNHSHRAALSGPAYLFLGSTIAPATAIRLGISPLQRGP